MISFCVDITFSTFLQLVKNFLAHAFSRMLTFLSSKPLSYLYLKISILQSKLHHIAEKSQTAKNIDSFWTGTVLLKRRFLNFSFPISLKCVNGSPDTTLFWDLLTWPRCPRWSTYHKTHHHTISLRYSMYTYLKIEIKSYTFSKLHH